MHAIHSFAFEGGPQSGSFALSRASVFAFRTTKRPGASAPAQMRRVRTEVDGLVEWAVRRVRDASGRRDRPNPQLAGLVLPLQVELCRQPELNSSKEAPYFSGAPFRLGRLKRRLSVEAGVGPQKKIRRVTPVGPNLFRESQEESESPGLFAINRG